MHAADGYVRVTDMEGCAVITARPCTTGPITGIANASETCRDAFDKADMIVIGAMAFDFRVGYGRRLRVDATVVQVSMDYSSVGKNRGISQDLVSNVGAVFKAVTQAVSVRVKRGPNERNPWMEELHAEEERLPSDRMARLKSAI